MVRLEVRSLVGDHGVGRGMGLVEAIAPELDDVVPGLLCGLLGTSIGHGAFNELRREPFHDLGLLLAHCLAQVVRIVERKPAEFHRRQHDLLLVDDAAVGVLQDRFKALVGVQNRDAPVLAVHEQIRHA